MEIIQNGVVFGILISFMLGPAFFILIETSIKKGFKAAIFLDIGILLSDAIYLDHGEIKTPIFMPRNLSN